MNCIIRLTYNTGGWAPMLEYILTNGEVPLVIGYILQPDTVPVPGTIYINTLNCQIFEIDPNQGTYILGYLNNPSIIQDTNTGRYYYATLPAKGAPFNLGSILGLYELGCTDPTPEFSLPKVTNLAVSGNDGSTPIVSLQGLSNIGYSFSPATNSEGQSFYNSTVSYIQDEVFYFDFSFLDSLSTEVTKTQLVIDSPTEIIVVTLTKETTISA